MHCFTPQRLTREEHLISSHLIHSKHRTCCTHHKGVLRMDKLQGLSCRWWLAIAMEQNKSKKHLASPSIACAPVKTRNPKKPDQLQTLIMACSGSIAIVRLDFRCVRFAFVLASHWQVLSARLNCVGQSIRGPLLRTTSSGCRETSAEPVLCGSITALPAGQSSSIVLPSFRPDLMLPSPRGTCDYCESPGSGPP